MQLERRRVLRRAAAGGVALGAASMVPLCVMEIAYVLLVHRPIFATYGEGVRFCLYLVMLLVCGGAVLGAIEGLVSLGISTLTKAVAKRRVAEPRWMAWFYSLMALPIIAVFSALTFSGRRAQQIPGKHLIAFALGLAALVCTYGFLRLVIGARDRFRIRRWERRQAKIVALCMLLFAFVLYVTDQTVLVRLYAFFHVGLMLGTVVFCQLAAGAVYMGHRPRSRWMGRLAEPSTALILFVAGVAGVVWSLNRVGKWETLRSFYYQHTVVQGKILLLASKLGLVQGAGRALLPEPAPAPLPQAAVRPGPRRPDANIILLSVDALRADHMGTYGYKRRTTPRLDRWARKAVVFQRGYCQVPHTSFSVTSLMTGTYVYSVSRATPGKRLRTVAEVLRRYGYKTAGFFPPAVFYIDRRNFTAFERSKFGFEYVKYEYLDADRRIDQVLDFLRENDKQRFFVWAHFFEAHEPYVIHQGFDFGPRAMDRYDSEIAFVDHHVGRLLEHVRKHHPNTIIALTADHGEEFGEHGGHYHGNSLYEQQVRVPLVISAPGVKPRRVDGAAQVIDLPVTLLSLVDVPASASMRGTDLGPWMAGELPSLLPPVFTEMEQKKLVLHGDNKLMCDTARGYCELYNLRDDPGERRNLVGRRPKLAVALRRKLSGWMASHAARDEGPDESEVARLLDRGRQKDMGAVPGLLKLTRSGNGLETRREAVRLLTLMRPPKARSALVRSAGDKDPGVRHQATVGAALLGHKPSLERLARLLDRPDLPPTLHRDALLALARSGDGRAAEALGSYLRTSREIYERIEIIEALGELGDPRAVPALMEQLKTLRTKAAAIEALGQVRARAAVPVLARTLRADRFVSWRRAAATALGMIGDRRAVPALSAAVREDLEAEVVADAVTSLQRLGGLPVPGIETLRPDPWTCQAGRCRLELRAACSADPHYLILALGGPDRPTVSVLCGARRVGGVDSAVGVTVVRGGGAPLSLEAPSPATIRYAGLRKLPTRGAR
jgi:arylsulfatase A-like enzyme/HEAT repeat protein